jgi:hypothetical protein
MLNLMEEIRTRYYHVIYDDCTGTVACNGTFQLGWAGDDIAVTHLLDTVVDQPHQSITLDLRGIEFLNTDGFSTLCRFVLKIHQKQTVQLTALISPQMPCQKPLLRMLRQCMPSMQMAMA